MSAEFFQYLYALGDRRMSGEQAAQFKARSRILDEQLTYLARYMRDIGIVGDF